MSTNLINIFDNINDVLSFLNKKFGVHIQIYKCCNGKIKNYLGYIWKWSPYLTREQLNAKLVLPYISMPK